VRSARFRFVQCALSGARLKTSRFLLTTDLHGSRQLGNLTSNTIIVALLSAKPVFRPSAVGTDPLGWLNERVGLNAKNGWSLSLEFAGFCLLVHQLVAWPSQSVRP